MRSNHPLLSVVIVNWNGSAFIQKCIRSVVEQEYQSLEIIVIDNASRDTSLKIIQDEFPQVEIIQNTENTGFAHGCNQGLQKARGVYVLFLNTDAWLEKNFFPPLIQRFEADREIGAIAPKLLRADNPEILDSCGSFWSITTWLYHVGYSKPANNPSYNKLRYFFTLKGAVLIVRRESVIKIGGLDDSFWCYYEDTDLCHRLWITGLSCLYCPQSTAYHLGGGSASQANNAMFHFHNFKNQIQSFIKNFSLLNIIWVVPLHAILMVGISIIWLLSGKIQHAKTVYLAFTWTTIHWKEIMQKRRQVQQLREVQDSVYLPQVTKNPSLAYIVHAFTQTTSYRDE